jgi:glucose/arabinose dehydrogenase
MNLKLFSKLEVRRISIAFIASIVISLVLEQINVELIFFNLSHRKNTSNQIHTNSITFDVSSSPVYSKLDQVVFTRLNLNGKDLIFSAKRDGQSINSLRHDSNMYFNIIETHSLKTQMLDRIFIYDLASNEDKVYASVVRSSTNGCSIFSILSLRVNRISYQLEDEREVWKMDECLHWNSPIPGPNIAGRLAFTSKGNLLVSMGLEVVSPFSQVYPNPNMSQLPKTLSEELSRNPLWGTIFEISKQTNTQPKIISKGFRSPQGLVVANRNGKDSIWVSDHGPRGGDELNLLEKGKDYGWPKVTFGDPYSYELIKQPGFIDVHFQTHKGYAPPKFFWTPSIAPSQLCVLPKGLIFNSKSWAEGDLILATLKAQSIFHIKLNDSGNIISVEQIDVMRRIRDIECQKNSITFSSDSGEIFELTPNPEFNPDGTFPKVLNYPIALPERNFVTRNFIRAKSIISNLIN